MQLRFLIPALVLSFAVAVASGPAAAQPGAEGPPGLFKGAGEAGPQTMNAVGQKRMATLKQDSTTQSIRLVRIAGNLSQRRTLVMHVGANRALAPEVPPAFQREHSGRSQLRKSGKEQAEGPGRDRMEKPGRRPGNRRYKLFVRRDGINARSRGTYTWKGTVRAGRVKKDENVGTVMLYHGKDGEITGTVRVKGEYYLIRPLSDGIHALLEVEEGRPAPAGDGVRYDGGGFAKSVQSTSSSQPVEQAARSASFQKTCRASTASLSPEKSTADEEEASSKTSAENTSTTACSQRATDVLAVYTESAADGRNIDGIINTAIDESISAYYNSNIDKTTLSLAHSEQVAFEEGNRIRQDMNRLVNSSSIKSLRDQYDADVVVLLTDAGYTTSDGNAIYGLADEIRAEAQDAYAIVEAPRATANEYTFTHEVGHLQGAQHNPLAACHPDNPAVNYPLCDKEGDHFSYAYGDRWTDADCSFWNPFCTPEFYRTIMAYGNATNINYFSNPNVTFDGEPTGTSERHNARALDATASTVKNFRVSDVLRASITMSGEPGDYGRTFTAGACGGTGSYSYEWRIKYDGSAGYSSVVSTEESFTWVFKETGTHFVELTVTSGAQSDVTYQSVYVSGESTLKTRTASVKSGNDSASSKQAGQVPTDVTLKAPAPNPLKGDGTIAYELPERTDVTLAVYDLMGRKVLDLATGTRGAGTHRARLDGTSLSSGVYVVRLRAGSTTESRRVTVVK